MSTDVLQARLAAKKAAADGALPDQTTMIADIWETTKAAAAKKVPDGPNAVQVALESLSAAVVDLMDENAAIKAQLGRIESLLLEQQQR